MIPQYKGTSSQARRIDETSNEDLRLELKLYRPAFGNYLQDGFVNLTPVYAANKKAEEPPSIIDWPVFVVYDEKELIAQIKAYNTELALTCVDRLEETQGYRALTVFKIVPIHRLHSTHYENINYIGFTLDPAMSNGTYVEDFDTRMKEVSIRLREYGLPDVFDTWNTWHSNGAYFYGEPDVVDKIRHILSHKVPKSIGLKSYFGFPREFYEAATIDVERYTD